MVFLLFKIKKANSTKTQMSNYIYSKYKKNDIQEQIELVISFYKDNLENNTDSNIDIKISSNNKFLWPLKLYISAL